MRLTPLPITALLLAGAGRATAHAQEKVPQNAGAPAKSYKTSRTEVWKPPPGGTQVPLWPDSIVLLKPDGDRAEETGTGTKLVAGRTWTWASYVSRPTMTIYRPHRRTTGAALLVLPGGGYAAVAMDLEGTEICDWATRAGMTCVVLKYRVPQTWRRGTDGIEEAPRVQLPLQDAQRAVGLLRARAAAYGIDPHKIGVIGFSAGGHLVAAVSNAEQRTYDPVDAADRLPSLPDFAIALYPGHLWAERSRDTGLALSPWVEISAKAPPTLLIHALDDATDDVRHSMAYALALTRAGVPVDLRLYARGGHAFGMRPTEAPVTRQWPTDVLTWLRTLRIR